ncbi:MAG: hypothetical protein IE928_09145 [Gammaproteobacteria bacterium]|nr:hypothetical protein [Gammaproteobacteria bacterium]
MAKQFESQIASKEVHEGGSYRIEGGKPVKVVDEKPAPAKPANKEAK